MAAPRLSDFFGKKDGSKTEAKEEEVSVEAGSSAAQS